MKTIEIVKRGGIDLLKGIPAALASLLGLMLGGLITSLLKLPSPAIPAQSSLSSLMPLMFISGILIAIVLGECFQRLSWSFWPRMLAIALSNYLLYYLLNLLDGLLFTPIPHMSTGIVSNLFPALCAGAVIAGLWRPSGDVLPAKNIILKYFSVNKGPGLGWRLLVAWLIYPPIYYLVGRVAALFTLHYYEDPSLNLGLALPDLNSLMLMQVLRGALFLLAVSPILLAWSGKRSTLRLWVGAVIFVQIAIQLIIQAYWLPLGLRIPHAIELLVDSFAQAGLYSWLLFPTAGSLHDWAFQNNQ